MDLDNDMSGQGLRQRAEAKVRRRQAVGTMAGGEEGDALRLLHELQVHQVELELQNEELQATRNELEAALSRHMDFYDLAPVAFLTLEGDSLIREANLTACWLLGVERSKLMGRRLREFFPLAERADFDACVLQVVSAQSRGSFEGSVLTGAGERHLHMELSAVDIGPLCRVVALDTTAQRQGERELRQERQFLRQVIDACPNLIYVKDREGRFLLGNAALAGCYGTTAGELAGHANEAFRVSVGDAAQVFRDDLEVIDTRQPKQILEEALTCADGSTRFFTVYKVPLVDEHDHCDRMLGVATDITALKEAGAALDEADRLKSGLLAMLGHDISPPLAPLPSTDAGNLPAPGRNPMLKRAHMLIDQQIRQLAHTVDVLLDTSSTGPTQLSLSLTRVELGSLIAHAVDTVRLITDDKQQTLDVALPDEPVWLQGDAVRLSQVVLTLLTHAANVTQTGGHIDLTARVAGQGERPEVALRVRDNGMGIAADGLQGSFDLLAAPAAGKELDIGLALSRKIVELHGGRLTASSGGPGQGSTFTAWLPIEATRGDT